LRGRDVLPVNAAASRPGDSQERAVVSGILVHLGVNHSSCVVRCRYPLRQDALSRPLSVVPVDCSTRRRCGRTIGLSTGRDRRV